jgi:hypothetical protein
MNTPPRGAETAHAVLEVAARKPKRQYSKHLKGVQQLERGMSKAAHRLVSSVDEGLRMWRKSTDKSSRKKKDGAIRDAVTNYAKAVSKGLRVASAVPLDLSGSTRKFTLRHFVARVFSPFFK